MTEWIEPVFDRTEEDVALAKAYNTNPAISDGATEYKGALNASDLNRIEGNCEYLAELLRRYGYIAHISSVKTDWVVADFPTLAQFTRIRKNITELMRVYAQTEDMPNMRSDERTDYIEINDMERDLARIKEIIVCMDQLIVPTGTYNAASVGCLKRETYGDALISADDFTLCDRIGVILCAKEKYE